MESSLLKSRASFLNQASKNVSSAPKPPKAKKEVKKRKNPESDAILKQMKQSASTAAKHRNKFRMIKIFVDYLKRCYLDKDFDHHSLEDMQQNLTPNNMDQDITDWLRQALIENPKVDYDPMARKFMFKPSLPIKKRSDLGKLLRQYDEKGLGGVMMGDIGEALANPEKVVKKLGDSALVIQRQDKEKVVFYKNPNLDIEVDEGRKVM
jgi:signal recognition particle GTPase